MWQATHTQVSERKRIQGFGAQDLEVGGRLEVALKPPRVKRIGSPPRNRNERVVCAHSSERCRVCPLLNSILRLLLPLQDAPIWMPSLPMAHPEGAHASSQGVNCRTSPATPALPDGSQASATCHVTSGSHNPQVELLTRPRPPQRYAPTGCGTAAALFSNRPITAPGTHTLGQGGC